MISSLKVYDSSVAKGENVLVGIARFSLRRGTISTTFSYDNSYLARNGAAYAICPELPLVAGPQHCAGLPGAMRDSAPDRWGRKLILRSQRENNAEAYPLRQLDDVDFLCGVFDETREGSLRFCEPGSNFIAQGKPIPPLLQLPSLLEASRRVAEDEAGIAQVKELLQAGSGSLGGARPKASVCENSKLLFAKFSHPHDNWDVMAWEKTALDMATAAGIKTPAASLIRIGDQSALVLDRFDRENSQINGRRIGFMSGMTALQANDGEVRDYAELMEEMNYLCASPREELRELFKRVVFSVAIHNNDDHLRNIGFLRGRQVWHLSPLFDVNPSPYLDSPRVTSIVGEGEVARETLGLTELAAYANLTSREAADIASEVVKVVNQWDHFAGLNKVSKSEAKLFEPVFKDRATAIRKAFNL